MERKSYCKRHELRVAVLGEGSTQAVLGIDGAGAPGAARTAAAAAPSYLRIEAASPLAAGTPETAEATVACPGGETVVGGGFRVAAGMPSATSNPGEVVVTESRAASDSSWTATAFADDAEDVGPWSLAAHAICVG